MSGRPKIFSENEILDRAIQVFWERGYEASSSAELLQAMKIGKGSFYLAFKGGKKELYERTLVHFFEKSNADFQLARQKAANPVTFITEFFSNLTKLSLERKRKGCYLGNAVIELSSTDPFIRDKAASLLARWEADFKDIIKKAQAEGYMKARQSPDVIARHLINLWNGINITQRMYPDGDVVKELIKMNLKIIE